MTDKQSQVLEFIRAYIEIKGFSPSMQDVATGLNLRSRSNIHRIMHKLRKEGLISLKAYKFRTVKISDRSVREMTSL